MKNPNTFKMEFCASNFNTINRSAFLYQDSIVFSSANLICCYSKQTQNVKKVIKITNGHNISFLDLFQNKFILVGCDDGNIKLLNVENFEILSEFKIEEKIKTGFIFTNNNCQYILIGADGKFLVLQNIDNNLKEITSIDFGTNYIECCSAKVYQDKSYVFITACDNQIHIYKLIDNNLEFLNSLPGHQNKIKAISQCMSTNQFVSCSLDNYIRLWKIQELENFSIENKNIYHLENNTIIELVSVLLGHSDGINSIFYTKKGFVSCGLDCSVLIWEQDESGIWYNSNRLGQVYGNNNVYFGICANESLTQILAWTFNGVPYLWIKQNDKWEIEGFQTGHSNKVTDIRWGNQGKLLASCSFDQTTRIFTKIKPSEKYKENYKEIGRAQIHGYDLNGISFLSLGDQFCDLLVCGADEKILRILEPVPHFINLNNVLTNNQMKLYLDNQEEQNCLVSKNPILYKAYYESGQEVLGLMTKQIKEERHNFYFDENTNEHKAKELSQEEYQKIPSEDFLVTQTLWPEVNKLYGHGYEISVLETSPDGKLLVSACKSFNKENSNIIIWDLKNYKPFYSIEAHNFTIFDIKIKDDKIITVSRDRQVAYYKKIKDKFELINIKSAHSRMIFSVSFSLCGNYFVTGSRDKSVKLWKIQEQDFQELFRLKLESPVHSVEFLSNDYIVAGLENGKIFLLQIKDEKIILVFGQQCCGKQINKIRRHPKDNFLFACCSDDNTSRVYKLEQFQL